MGPGNPTSICPSHFGPDAYRVLSGLGLLHPDPAALGAFPLSLLMVDMPFELFHRYPAGLTGHVCVLTASMFAPSEYPKDRALASFPTSPFRAP